MRRKGSGDATTSCTPRGYFPPAPVQPYPFPHLLRGARSCEGIERQEDAAARVGLSKTRYWEFETGRLSPNLAEQAALLAAFPILGRLLAVAQDVKPRA